MRSTLPLCVALALGACATNAPRDSVFTRTAAVRFGQTATVGPLRVRPIALVEDSRCPINARCIWAGRLILKVQVELRGGGERLTTNLTLGSPYIVGADRLTLVAAEPDRLAGANGHPPANLFTFDYAAMR